MADTGRVTALMTAESIIVALLIAYAPTINNTLVTLMKRGEPIFGTVLAGLLISAVALTAFRSLLLLYKSIDISNVDDVMRSDENYRAGYDLFLMVILGSGVYVLTNAFSIVHYAIWRSNVVFSCVPVSPSELSSIETPNIEVVGIFIGVWVILSVFRPFHVTRFFRCIRDNLGTCLLPYSVILAVSTAILAVISGVQGTKWWPWCSWSVWPSLAVFGSLTIAALWMLMIPEQERRRGET